MLKDLFKHYDLKRIAFKKIFSNENAQNSKHKRSLKLDQKKKENEIHLGINEALKGNSSFS